MLCARKHRDASLRAGPRPCPGTCKLSVLPLVLILVCFSTCAHRDPKAVYDHAEQILQQGYITAAGKEAEEGYRDFHSVSRELAWKFAILRARVLHWKGRNDGKLTLLAPEPEHPLSCELAGKKQRPSRRGRACLQTLLRTGEKAARGVERLS